MSELLWVAVPGGAVPPGGKPVLRALVVPRLGGAEPGVLAGYGLADWPSVLAAASLTVEVAPDQQGPAHPVAAVRGRHVQEGVWSAFFAPDMPVRPWRQRGYSPPAVERTAALGGTILRNYTASARALAAPTPHADPYEVVRQQYADWAAAERAPETGTGEPEPWQEPDFHRAVAFLREHPAVLRALGLIVELTVEPDDLRPSTPAAPWLVRVGCAPAAGFSADVRMVSAWTAYQFTGGRFLPAPPAGSDIAGGMVNLAGARALEPSAAPDGPPKPAPRSRWQVATFDVDGGAGRLRSAAGALGSGPADPGRAALPALRSAGLMLVRDGREAIFRARAAAATGNAAAGGQLRLTADDLVLGYRLDVRELDGEWLSLCRRTASYTVGGRPIEVPNPDEEGHVKAHAATAVGSGAALRADEVVARWDGWSLVVRRPVFDEHGVRAAPRERLPMPFDLDWAFDLDPGWLPRLRYGVAYQLRLRVADMAGGGLGMDTASNEHATELVSYRRHEPIPAPEIPLPAGVLVPDGRGGTKPDPAALGPGGMVDQLVIRSDPAAGLDVARFAERHPGYPANDRRALVPPAGSMTLAEQHGRFDGVDDIRAWEWVRRAAAPPVATEDGRYSWLPDPAAAGVVIRVRPEPGGPPPGTGIDDDWGPGWPDLPAKSLHLVPGGPDRPIVAWQDGGRRAEVSLRPGVQVTLEVSSHPEPADIGEFEIRQWLGQVSDTTVLVGAHPMVTPARPVRLVHAVRRPLAEPHGTLVADRSAGETFALVHDPQDPLLGIDVASTAQVDLSARWDEYEDAAEPRPTTEEVLSAPLGPGVRAVPEMRHEFGDTRHRRVTYTVTALSRFRQFFDPGPDADFRAAATLAQVSVPSSARPAPPMVVSTAPAFRWEGVEVPPGWESLRRSRLGGRLRIELAPPWYTTGEGELLAVLVRPAGRGGDLPAAAWPHLSWTHRDPIWATPSPAAAVDAAMFTGFAAEPGPRPGRLAETGHEVLAVPYAVWHRDGRWYADVELPGPGAASYCPFVRLAVARYQPDSLPGLELSTAVRTEPVQLLPDRTLTVQRTGGGLQVTLAGIGPLGPRQSRVVAAVERCTLPPGVPVETVELAAVGAGSADVAAWRHVPEHTVLGSLNTALPLPLPPLTAGDALRLVVREVEQIPGDRAAAGLAERTVFADVLPLTAPPDG